MEAVYIVSIVVGGIFLALVIVYICWYTYNKKQEDAREAMLYEMYVDSDLAKMDYDFAVYDAETERLLNAKENGDGQITIDDVIQSEEKPDETAIFTQNDVGDVEEITGNYKP